MNDIQKLYTDFIYMQMGRNEYFKKIGYIDTVGIYIDEDMYVGETNPMQRAYTWWVINKCLTDNLFSEDSDVWNDINGYITGFDDKYLVQALMAYYKFKPDIYRICEYMNDDIGHHVDEYKLAKAVEHITHKIITNWIGDYV